MQFVAFETETSGKNGKRLEIYVANAIVILIYVIYISLVGALSLRMHDLNSLCVYFQFEFSGT